jgi:hypothetical protein
LLCKINYFLSCVLGWKEQIIQTNPINNNLSIKKLIKWKSVILQRKRKKNHGIWSSYKKEILITNFCCESNRKNESSVCSSSSPDIATWWNFIGSCGRPNPWRTHVAEKMIIYQYKRIDTKLMHNNTSTTVVSHMSGILTTWVQNPDPLRCSQVCTFF